MKEEVYINDLVKRYPALESCKGDINQAIQAIIKCYSDNGKLLICGNGGSCADADHIVGELMKSFEKQRPVDDELRNSLLSVSDERG
ncbi:MAG: SIS domain-containing protein, partial [Bacteroidetes bacterium]|nr:SIS domain-containing protein [Bacteroidota bacterium]